MGIQDARGLAAIQALGKPPQFKQSLAAMVATRSLKVGDTVQTPGYGLAGDGGANLYEIVADGTGTADGGTYIDLDNGLQAKGLFPNGVYVNQYGPNTTPGTTIMDDAFHRAAAAGHKVIKFWPGIYEFNQISSVLDNDLSVELNGSIIRGSDDVDYVDQTIAIFNCGTATNYKFNLVGPGTIDGTKRTNIDAVASGSGVQVKYARNGSDVRGVYFYSGDSRTSGYGDSGLVLSGCRNFTVDACAFKGWNDHAVYSTGGALDDPGGAEDDDTNSYSLIVTGSQFNETGSAIRLARNHRGAVIMSNIFKDVERAVVVAGGGTNWYTARGLILTGNYVEGCDAEVFDIRYMPATWANVISGNEIYDWAKTSEEAAAINLRGVSNTTVIGNTIKPLNSVAADNPGYVCANGVYMQKVADGDDGGVTDYDDDVGGPYSAINNLVANNIILVIEHGLTGSEPTNVNNYGVIDNSNENKSRIEFNTLNSAINGDASAPYDCRIDSTGSNAAIGSPRFIRRTLTGVGLNGVVPKGSLDTVEKLIASRAASPSDTYVVMEQNGSGRITGYSPVDNAKTLIIDARTDAAGTTPTGGLLALFLRINGSSRLELGDTHALFARPVKKPSYTVAGLPSAATVGFGAEAYASDSNATLAAGHGNTVAGGGANKVPVWSDGTNWIIG